MSLAEKSAIYIKWGRGLALLIIEGLAVLLRKRNSVTIVGLLSNHNNFVHLQTLASVSKRQGEGPFQGNFVLPGHPYRSLLHWSKDSFGPDLTAAPGNLLPCNLFSSSRYQWCQLDTTELTWVHCRPSHTLWNLVRSGSGYHRVICYLTTFATWPYFSQVDAARGKEGGQAESQSCRVVRVLD